MLFRMRTLCPMLAMSPSEFAMPSLPGTDIGKSQCWRTSISALAKASSVVLLAGSVLGSLLCSKVLLVIYGRWKVMLLSAAVLLMLRKRHGL